MENTTQSATPAAPKSGGWKTMGIISIIFAGLVIIFSFIPCLGAYAMYLAIVPIILSVIALAMANSAKASKSMAIIGLVVSLVAAAIGYWQYTKISKFGDALKTSLQHADSVMAKDTTKH